MPNYVYGFHSSKGSSDKLSKSILGNKGAGLLQMVELGIPVPPGFTISTEACLVYEKTGQFPSELKNQIRQAMAEVEKALPNDAKFGDAKNPMLVSVRSGAAVSMPGMMDSILNLGLNDQTAAGFAQKTGNPRFVYDSYRRFVQMFSEVVLHVGEEENPGQEHLFENLITQKKQNKKIVLDSELTTEDLKELTSAFKQEALLQAQASFPEDPWEQLWAAIAAVFQSWKNPRAVAYRNMYHIPHHLGTAVTIQAMVFGNMGTQSGTGVLFTRHPSTGEKKFYGEFLVNAQGEDVVAGTRTPEPLEKLAATFPTVMKELIQHAARLEKHLGDMQDIEFTIQEGKLWLLQTRAGKRCGKAMVKIAVDLVHEGLLSKEDALLRIIPAKFHELFHPVIDDQAKKELLCKGLPASPGAVSGPIVFTTQEAQELAKQGIRPILVRNETSPEDIQGMQVSAGILTARGGMTSHAAVVARGMGRCCVVGASALQIQLKEKSLQVKNHTLLAGDVITLDGSTGEVFLGSLPLIEPNWENQPEYQELMSWADQARRLRIRANADTAIDAKTARRFGAEGIGLCRTEHMFFAEERMIPMLRMILAETPSQREAALSKLLPFQRSDFEALFTEMDGLPVTIRLLDPPLHEFLPKTEEEEQKTAQALQVPLAWLKKKKQALHEENPMLGYRGARLGILHPEIYKMQTQAIFEAAHHSISRGIQVKCEIMLPLIGHEKELLFLKEQLLQTVHELGLATKALSFTIGTMIELPRACMTADQIARTADFFSFGTNDLTQTTLGLSRDDSGQFLPQYVELGIYPEDPFVTLDQTGVGALMELAIQKGRSVKPALKIGICGEHGGDPKTIEFCQRQGFDYVSCSPYRVPLARLAAAQACLREEPEPALAKDLAAGLATGKSKTSYKISAKAPV